MSKKTRGVEIKEQTARKELENFRTRSKPFEGDLRISTKETREIENKEQTARKDSGRRSKPPESD